jgi:predicted ester cyclase
MQQIEIERNKAVIRRFVEEVQNQKNWDVYDELNDPEFVNLSSPPGVPSDREGGKAYLGGFLNAFPDAHFQIDDMIAQGDQVVTKTTFTGTHTADLGELPATGRASCCSSSTSCESATAGSSSTGSPWISCASCSSSA